MKRDAAASGGASFSLQRRLQPPSYRTAMREHADSYWYDWDTPLVSFSLAERIPMIHK
jgi:hypothetical protein